MSQDTAAEITTTTVSTQFGDISISRSGAGAPLVMLHGGGPGASALANYRDNLPAFVDDFEVILPDQPGFGDSYIPTEADLLDKGITNITVEALLEALDNAGIDRFHLMGNSLGGAAAIAMAIAAPTRVLKLILMAPGGGWFPEGPRPTEGQKMMFRYYNGEGPTLKKMKDFVSMMVADPRQFDAASIQKRYDASLDPRHIAFYHEYNNAFAKRRGMDPLWRDVHKITAPTLLLWGRDDRTITLAGAGVMLANIRNVQMHVFGNCGHWVQVERKAEFERLVLDFLAE
ncbi:alpha/beta fold hydrolase [Cryobacterium frigoriphilum]|uniref:Alpha/beta fold hydrolase n=2 Tax=Cryobacterium frigoriphilum TaxID=1259150 RepID=A0A4R9A517_9MICO|nr:alpha/beta fold hydrolase [Cryobacterium frigoriphilum]